LSTTLLKKKFTTIFFQIRGHGALKLPGHLAREGIFPAKLQAEFCTFATQTYQFVAIGIVHSVFVSAQYNQALLEAMIWQ
jgi:hypothetical protein